jgi:hypothetical protein
VTVGAAAGSPEGAALLAQALVAAASLSVVLGLAWQGRLRSPELGFAVCVAGAWVTLSRLYRYQGGDIGTERVNLFAIACWSAGLAITIAIYDLWRTYPLAKTVGIYVPGLLVLEYVGFNLLGIRLSSSYRGLLGLPLLHVPPWAQGWYLLAGPSLAALLRSFLSRAAPAAAVRKGSSPGPVLATGKPMD